MTSSGSDSVREPLLGSLHYTITHSLLQLQRKDAVPSASGQVPTMTIDLKDGKVQCTVAQKLADGASPALGIIGLLRLEGGAVLVMATKARKVCTLPHSVYKVTATQLITHENVKKTFKDLRLAHLLQEAMDVKTYCQHMYFSYDRDLTRSVQSAHQQQQQQQDQAQPGRGTRPSLLQCADPSFVANGALLQPFSEAGAGAFGLPLIVGYVGQVVNPVFTLADVQGLVPEPQRSPQQEGGEQQPESGKQQEQGEQKRGGKQQQGENQQEEGEQQQQSGKQQQEGSPAGLGSGSSSDDPDPDLDAEVDPGLGWSHFQRQGQQLGPQERRGHITLVARMAATRQGTLLWRKGLDLEGHAAHLTEVEQTVVVELPGGAQQWLSHVQVRSSAPLLWSQPPDVWPTPKVRIVRDMDAQETAFKRFAQRQLMRHGRVALLHLPGSHHKESAVQAVLQSVVGKLGDAAGGGAGAGMAGAVPARSAAGAQPVGGKGGRAAVSGAMAADDDDDDGPPLAVPLKESEGLAAAPASDSGKGTVPASGSGKGPMLLGKRKADAAGTAAGGRDACGQLECSGLSLVVGGSGVVGLSRLRGMDLIASASRQQLLWEQVSDAVRSHGHFAARTEPPRAAAPAPAPASGPAPSSSPGTRPPAGGGAPGALAWASGADAAVSLQSGVLHVSGWDTVDEMQVVQQAVALRVMESQLRNSGLLSEGVSLATAYPEVLQAMRTLWSNMGNVTADQTSGVGSMAGAVLHSGYLSVLTRVTNLYFLGERWFHGAFLDARKQDAIDLVCGVYKITRDDPGPTPRKNNYGALEVGGALAAWGLSQLYYVVLHQQWQELQLMRFALGVLLPLVAGVVVLGVGVALGVEQPQLCPQLVAPGWQGGSGL